jgi:subtilase family serine protease
VESYNSEFSFSVVSKITLIAASNDWGSNNSVPWGTITGEFWTKALPNSYLMPQYSPYVTAVGGTALTLMSGGYGSEVGWSRSGGGPSNLFPQPTWQTGPGVPRNGYRDIPDIALDASCDTPYAFVWQGNANDWFCGTSAGAYLRWNSS